jgi:hypothetical protein
MLETAIDLAMQGYDLGNVLRAFSQVRQFRALGEQSYPIAGRTRAGTIGRSANPMPFPRAQQGDIITVVGVC